MDVEPGEQMEFEFEEMVVPTLEAQQMVDAEELLTEDDTNLYMDDFLVEGLEDLIF